MGVLKLLRVLLVLALSSVVSFSAFAEDLYYAETQAGNFSGSGSCANAIALSAIQWGDGAGKITAGDTAHLCGTINIAANTVGLTVGASGTDGNPITIKFEDGAILQSPQFNINGGIYINAKDYITIDGGTNGIIRNTDNGTSLTYQLNSIGIKLYGASSHIEIKNLTITDIYKHSTDLANVDVGGTGVYIISSVTTGSDISIHDNTLSWGRAGIQYGLNVNSGTNVDIYNNSISHMGWGMYITCEDSDVVISNFKVHDNEITDWSGFECPGGHTNGLCGSGVVEWDAETTYGIGDRVHATASTYMKASLVAGNTGNSPPALGTSNAYWQDLDIYHQDGIFVSGTAIQSVVHLDIYNNYIHGLTGGSVSWSIYCSHGGTLPGMSTHIYNNILTKDAVRGGIGNLGLAGGATYIIENNTVEAGNTVGDYSCFTFAGSAAHPGIITLYNNICYNAAFGVKSSSLYYTLDADYNLWYGMEAADGANAAWSDISMHCVEPDDGHLGWCNKFWQWQGAGHDAHGYYENPNLTASYRPQSTSGNVIAGGADLSGTFTTDYDGVTRTVPWSIGAYEYRVVPNMSNLGTGAITITPNNAGAITITPY
jgi:hypothetical protein